MKITLFFAIFLSIFGRHAAAADPNDAIVRLLKAGQFAFGGVGFAPTISDGEKAYNEIVASPTAKGDFEKAFHYGTPVAKAYALVGLFQLDRAKFDALSAEFRKQNATVSTMTGCVVSPIKATQVVNEIATGAYSKKK